MTCWLRKQILVKAWIMITHLVVSENGESRLRRSLDACALDFIVSIRRCYFFCFVLQSGFLPKLNFSYSLAGHTAYLSGASCIR